MIILNAVNGDLAMALEYAHNLLHTIKHKCNINIIITVHSTEVVTRLLV